MGFYIEVPQNKQKAEQIRDLMGGEIVSQQTAFDAMSDPEKAVIVVLDNGPFEAAGFAYNDREFMEFTDPRDFRPRKFVILPRQLVLDYFRLEEKDFAR